MVSGRSMETTAIHHSHLLRNERIETLLHVRRRTLKILRKRGLTCGTRGISLSINLYSALGNVFRSSPSNLGTNPISLYKCKKK